MDPARRMNDFDLRPTSLGIDRPISPIATRASGIALWQPRIVLPERAGPTPAPRVILAEPGTRPEAVTVQVEAARSALEEFATLRAGLEAHAAVLAAHAREAGTERGHVTAVIETYRVKTALDEALRDTVRRARALMEDRGLR